MKAVRTISCLLSLLVSVTSLSAKADSLLVLKSNARDWRQGATIDGAAVLTLVEGEQLTLLSDSGKEIAIAGPYSAAPLPIKMAPTGGGLIHSLSPLFTDTSKDETVIGAFRAPDEDREALAWMIDAALLAEKSSIVCRDAHDALSFARPKGVETARALLERLGSSSRAEMVFLGDTVAVPWPAAVAVEDSARYRLTIEGEAASTEFVVALLPIGLPTPAHRAAWMANHGCRVQARRLILVSY